MAEHCGGARQSVYSLDMSDRVPPSETSAATAVGDDDRPDRPSICTTGNVYISGLITNTQVDAPIDA